MKQTIKSADLETNKLTSAHSLANDSSFVIVFKKIILIVISIFNLAPFPAVA
jgi:hypothetical protein